MSSPFGSSFSTTPAFGASSGQSTPSFGISGGGFGSSGTGGSLFGQTPNQTMGGGGVFGGATSSGLFSSFNQTPPSSGFSPSPTPSAFGQSSGGGGFGQSSPGGGGFGQGSSASLPRFGAFGGSTGPAPGTYGVAFEKVQESDSSTSRSDAMKAFYMNMSAMGRYLNQPLDAMRATDYKNGHKRKSGNIQTNLGSQPTGGLFTGGTGFGQSSGMSRFGFGASTTGSVFGSGSAGGSGFGGGSTGGAGFRSATSPGFGATTSQSVFGAGGTGGGMFGQTGPGFGGGFGQTPATGGGLFTGQSTGSVFGASTGGFGSLGAPQPSVFGSGGTGGGFSFGAASSSPGGGVFGAPTTGGNIFGQTPTPGTAMFGFQSSTPLFTNQAGQNLFQTGGGSIFGPPQGAQANTAPSIFGPQATPAPQGLTPTPAAVTPSQSFFSSGANQISSTHPNWTPAYGIVAPSLAQYEELLDGRIAGQKLDKFEHMRGSQGAKIVAIPYPVKYVLDERPLNEGNRALGNDGWASSGASVAKPAEPTVQQKLEKWIQELKKQQESPVVGSASSSRPLGPSQSQPDASRQDPVEMLVQAEEARKHQSGSSDLSDAEAEALLPVLSDDDYYIIPNREGLLALLFSRGKDALKKVYGVEIGKRDVGSVIFSEAINLERLDVVRSFQFKRGSINIPSDSSLKGVAGTVKLLKVFFKGANHTGEKDDIELATERNKAKKLCASRGYSFCSFEKDGTWVFKLA